MLRSEKVIRLIATSENKEMRALRVNPQSLRFLKLSTDHVEQTEHRILKSRRCICFCDSDILHLNLFRIPNFANHMYVNFALRV